MLSWPKGDGQPTGIEEIANLSSTHRFDRILDSLEGLRQLTHDLTLDEIVIAQSQAKQLIENLSSLHSQLGKLSQINDRLGPIKTQGYSTAHEESTEKKPRPFQVKAVSNLIPFPATPKSATQNSVQKTEPTIPETLMTDEPQEIEQNIAQGKRSRENQGGLALSEAEQIAAAMAETNPAPLQVETDPEGYEIEANSAPNTDERTRGVPRFETLLHPSKARNNQQETGSRNVHTPELTQPEATASHAKITYHVSFNPANKRTDFDHKVRELIRHYGEVDIYSGHGSAFRKRTIRNTVAASVVMLVVFLAFSGSSPFFSHFQLRQSDVQVPQLAAEPASLKTDTPQAITTADTIGTPPMMKAKKQKMTAASKIKDDETSVYPAGEQTSGDQQ